MGPLGHSLSALSALAGVPVGALALVARPSWRGGWRQRLGTLDRSVAGGVWVHAASVGETRAARPLLRALVARGEVLTLTHTRGAALSVDVGEVVGPALASRGLAPLDHPWCLWRALDRVAPRALVLVETELWPNAIREATARGVAVGVVSASISPRSFKRYQRVRRWVAPTFRRLAFVAARSEPEAARFEALGVPSDRVQVTGDLKLDVPVEEPGLPQEVAATLGDTPLFVAGSTHEGEEEAVLAAVRRCQERGVAARFAIAPRRLERCGAVARSVEREGLRPRLRSHWGVAPLAADEVALVDRTGELPSWYRAATVAFVGGTLVPVGGHNLYEPIERGAFVLFGPGVSAVPEAADRILRANAGVMVDGASALAEQAAFWLARPRRARESAARGDASLAAHRGSAARSLAWLDRALLGGAGP